MNWDELECGIIRDFLLEIKNYPMIILFSLKIGKISSGILYARELEQWIWSGNYKEEGIVERTNKLNLINLAYKHMNQLSEGEQERILKIMKEIMNRGLTPNESLTPMIDISLEEAVSKAQLVVNNPFHMDLSSSPIQILIQIDQNIQRARGRGNIFYNGPSTIPLKRSSERNMEFRLHAFTLREKESAQSSLPTSIRILYIYIYIYI